MSPDVRSRSCPACQAIGPNPACRDDWHRPQHQCPGPECELMVDYDLLACSSHWFQVPYLLRLDVQLTWRASNYAGSVEHHAACQRAIAKMRKVGT